MNVSYEWSGDYDLLVEIEGAAHYRVTIGLDYINPENPDDIDPEVVVNETTQTRAKVLHTQTVLNRLCVI